MQSAEKMIYFWTCKTEIATELKSQENYVHIVVVVGKHRYLKITEESSLVLLHFYHVCFEFVKRASFLIKSVGLEMESVQ